MPEDFSFERRVEFCETDAAGIVHFSSFILYMEQAEHALLRSLGLSVASSVTSKPKSSSMGVLSWPRVRVECDFHVPARFEDILLIRVQVSSLGRKSVTFGHRIFSDTFEIATGSITSVCCRHENGSLIGTEIPEEIRQSLSRYLFEKKKVTP